MTVPAAGPTLPDLESRASGILLHPTSLPGPHGCGDLGRSSRRFVGWLQQARQRLWQMLPVGPLGYGNSPYSARSAFAGNPLLLSLEDLSTEGLLPGVVRGGPFPNHRVDYGRVGRFRVEQLRRAFAHWKEHPRLVGDFERFRQEQADWLSDFSLFEAIKEQLGGLPWHLWPPPLRDRDPEALLVAGERLRDELERCCFEQWQFHRQWTALRSHCHERGIALVGDVPIFLAHDSADVWTSRGLFDLDERGALVSVAGVPPDYFSATGQRWGNPLYRWDALETTGYRFWIERFRHALERFDFVRLDHFIGFVRFWEIPSREEVATHGAWKRGPGIRLFEALRRALGLERLPFIAEDLGAVTPEVYRLRDDLGLPGTKILQFAFGDDPQASSFKPYSYPRLAVVYTGTHDNDTAVGWIRDRGGGSSPRTPEQAKEEKAQALRFLGSGVLEFHWNLIRAAQASVANFSIFPLQDVLGLGSSARMNRPGTVDGNWEWRTRSLPARPALRLAEMTEMYGRT